jgi:hypothetical protein
VENANNKECVIGLQCKETKSTLEYLVEENSFNVVTEGITLEQKFMAMEHHEVRHL